SGGATGQRTSRGIFISCGASVGRVALKGASIRDPLEAWAAFAPPCSATRTDAPDGVRQVIGHDEGPTGIDGYPDRTATCLAVGAKKAGDEVDRWARRAAIAKRHEHHLV